MTVPIYTYRYIHTFMYTFINTHTHMSGYVKERMCKYSSVGLSLIVCVYMCVCVLCVCVCVCVRVCAYIHIIPFLQ